MNKGTMTVLGHQVEYDTDNVVIDENAEETLQVAIMDAIEYEQKISGTENMTLEDEQGNQLLVTATWKIVNPEAEKWKSIAKKLYDAVISADEWSIYHLSTACNEYREAIKEQEL